MNVTTPAPDEPVAAIAELFAAAGRAGIRFAHWKSNSHLTDAVQGRTDLDLLVDRSGVEEFRRLLSDHGFKSVHAAPGKHYAGVENFLGFDPPSGRLVHLHVHYQLVLGQQFVKDHQIPIEDQLLDSIRELAGTPIPSAAMELSILAVRAVLKYRLRDAVKDIVGIRSPAIPVHIRDEAVWLVDQTSVSEVRQVVAELGGALDEDLVIEVLDLLTSTAPYGLRPLMLRTKMRRAIRPFRRMSRLQATSRYLLALARKRWLSIGLGTKHRMTPRSGGTTIAFVGSDGAGKSTVIEELTDWLSWRLDVATVYMGNPKAAPGLWLLKRSTKWARSVHVLSLSVFDENARTAALTRELWRLMLASRRVAEAQHRYRHFVDAQRRVGAGSVVFFDRYPLDVVRINGRAMDGPRLGVELDSPRSRLLEHLVGRERRIFGRILPPDHVIVLSVSPEVSQRRKPDHDRASVESKTEAVGRVVDAPGSFTVIDADRELSDVVEQAKSAVWDWL